jgi:hypothetical protein
MQGIDATGEPLKACITSPVVYNYTKAPMFISQNAEDMYQVLIVDRGDGSDHAYDEFVREHITGSLTMSNIITPAKKKDGLFVPACKAHCLQYVAAIESAPQSLCLNSHDPCVRACVGSLWCGCWQILRVRTRQRRPSYSRLHTLTGDRWVDQR